MNSYKIEAGTAQHIGNRQQQNDRTALFTGARAPGYVLAVLADAVSGGAAASEQVLHTAKQVFDEFKPGDNPSIERMAELLREIVQETHTIVRLNSATSKEAHLSTFAGLVMSPTGKAVWATVGDSRVYRIASGQCMERTNDAAYVDHLMATDKLPLEAARNHRHSKLLSNLIGNADRVPFPMISSHEPLAAGDTFLLCSDGLWMYFTDAELGAVTHKNAPRQASELLINKGQERAQGKGDNCTMAIIKLVRPPKEAPTYTVQKMRRAI